MLIAYVDESADRARRHYYIGALLVDTKAIAMIENGLDRLCSQIAGRVAGFQSETEIHAYEMFHGLRDWDCVPVRLRVHSCVTAARIIGQSGAKFVLRGVDTAALARKYVHPFEPHQLALAHALESVDTVVTQDRLNDRVLVVADDHHSALESRTSFRSYRLDKVAGWVSHPLSSLADVIYFGPSRYSRLLQATDLVTFFENRRRNNHETHSEALAAMADIDESLAGIRRFSYIWP